jgi:hypothetical protein
MYVNMYELKQRKKSKVCLEGGLRCRYNVCRKWSKGAPALDKSLDASVGTTTACPCRPIGMQVGPKITMIEMNSNDLAAGCAAFLLIPLF